MSVGTTQTRDFDKTLALVGAAVDGVYHSDAGPYVALLADRAPVSLFGALGPCETGKPSVAETLQRVASRFSDGAMVIDYEVVEVGADFAYTVGYESGHVTIDGTPGAARLRVTHIFRLEDGAWRLVHRHGDFAPTSNQPWQSRPNEGGTTC
jgi:ketosteroid isomerase-like protein